MGSYATRAQFFTFGLLAAVCTPASRSLSSVVVANSAFELSGHGFGGGEILRFVALGEDAELPAGLDPTKLYEVEILSSDFFKVNYGGVAVVITTVGVGVIAIAQDIGPKIDAFLEARSSYLDAHLKAHKPPLNPVPMWATLTVCKLAALDVVLFLRHPSPTYNLEDVRAEAEKAEAFCARLATGKPTADRPTDQTPSKAEQGAKGWKGKASSDWQNSGNGGAL